MPLIFYRGVLNLHSGSEKPKDPEARPEIVVLVKALSKVESLFDAVLEQVWPRASGGNRRTSSQKYVWAIRLHERMAGEQKIRYKLPLY